LSQANVPRLSYLPFLLPRLHAFFSSSLIDPTIPPYDGWFAFESIPLKWHLPIGLLYDLYSGAEASRGGSNRRKSIIEPDTAAAEAKELPWKLILYFGDWPTDKLVRCDAEGKVVQDAFINMVKEADTVRYGNARGIMSLSKHDSNDLWEGVKSRM
jgi:autophagy-related protein 5